MNVRQYIGARYVTKIYENSLDPSSAEWEAGVTYEPLTLVTYNYGSYLSKTAVPGSVGDPASNPTYWVQTGFYNGQIAGLQAQIDNIIDNIIPSLAHSRKFLYIGDSMLALTDNWGKALDTITGNTDSTFVCEGGAGFRHGGNNTGRNFGALYAAATVPDDITDVIIYGGTNDCNSTDAAYVGNEIAALCSQIFNDHPNVNIYIAFNITYTHGSGSNWNTVRPYIRQVVSLVKSNTPASGAILMTSPSYACLDNTLTSDSVHPTATGSQRIANAMFNELNSLEWALPIITNPASDTKGFGMFTCMNDYITVTYGFGYALYNDDANPISLTPNTWTDLGATTSLPLYPRYDNQFAAELMVRIKKSDDSLYYTSATIDVDHNGHAQIVVHESGLTAKQIVIQSFANKTVPVYN